MVEDLEGDELVVEGVVEVAEVTLLDVLDLPSLKSAEFTRLRLGDSVATRRRSGTGELPPVMPCDVVFDLDLSLSNCAFSHCALSCRL